MREAIEAETDFIWQQSKVLPAFTRVFFKTVLIFSNRYIPSSRVSRGCVGFLDLTLGGGYNAWIRTDRNPGGHRFSYLDCKILVRAVAVKFIPDPV